MIRWLILVAALAVVCVAAADANACYRLTPAGEAERERQEAKWLRKNSDRIVTGTWHLTEESSEENGYFRIGYVEVGSGKRLVKYRLSIPDVINCGFPYYYVKDGEEGRFYLERDDPESDDADDGFIDAYDYLHFVRAGEAP